MHMASSAGNSSIQLPRRTQVQLRKEGRRALVLATPTVNNQVCRQHSAVLQADAPVIQHLCCSQDVLNAAIPGKLKEAVVRLPWRSNTQCLRCLTATFVMSDRPLATWD